MIDEIMIVVYDVKVEDYVDNFVVYELGGVLKIFMNYLKLVVCVFDWGCGLGMVLWYMKVVGFDFDLVDVLIEMVVVVGWKYGVEVCRVMFVDF